MSAFVRRIRRRLGRPPAPRSESLTASDEKGGIRPALRQACRVVDLDPKGAELVNRSVHAVYRLAAAPVMVRLRRGTVDQNAREQVRIARWLAESNAPVTRLLDCDQLVDAGGYYATFWEAASEPSQEWRTTHLGTALRRLHQVEPIEELHRWTPFDTMRRRTTVMEWLDPRHRAWLARQIDDSEAAFGQAEPTLRKGVIHGDGHIANLLQDHQREPVLCDLDSVARGPLLQDLVPTALSAVRFEMRGRQRAMVGAYGIDVTKDPAWPVLRRIRELSTTTFGLAKSRGQGSIAAEAPHRLDTLRDGKDNARWHSYQGRPATPPSPPHPTRGTRG